jgi:hypothetical protein
MFESFINFAKNALVSASILKPIYTNVQVPFYQNICKPIIEMAIECTWWVWCSIDVKDVGKQCKSKQTIEEICDLTGYELNISQEAIAIGTGALTLLAGSYFLYSRNRKHRQHVEENTHPEIKGTGFTTRARAST